MKRRNAIISIILVICILFSQFSMHFLSSATGTETEITREAELAESFANRISAPATTGYVTENLAGVEFSDVNVWSVSDDWGRYWHMDSDRTVSGYCDVNGYAIFDAGKVIDSFAFKMHTDNGSGAERINSAVKLYGSADKEGWKEIDFNVTEPTRPTTSTNYYYSFVYAAFALDVEIRYIKVQIVTNSWDGIFPGIYYFDYNLMPEPIINRDAEMAESFTNIISAPSSKGNVTANPQNVKFSDINQWSVSEDWGYYWHMDSDRNASDMCDVDGFAIFDAGKAIDNFAFKIHTDDSTSTNRIDSSVKLYGSTDKSKWIEMDYRVTNPIRPTSSTQYYYSYVYAALAENTDIRYIKISVTSNSWNGVFPGIYNFQYNLFNDEGGNEGGEEDTDEPDPSLTVDSAMASDYTANITPDTNTDKAELVADSGYQWSKLDWYGNLWYVWDGDSSASTSNTKGNIVFDAGDKIDNFRMGFHIATNNTARLDGIKLYVSKDKSSWSQINYKISQTEPVGERFRVFIYADLTDTTDFRYVKLLMNPEQSFWHGIDPGVYGLYYNLVSTGGNESGNEGSNEGDGEDTDEPDPTLTVDADILDSYTYIVSAPTNKGFVTENTEEVEFSDLTQWSVNEDWGNYWHMDSDRNANGECNVSGYAVFKGIDAIKNFAFKVHTDNSNSVNRIQNAVKLYVSSDNQTWKRIKFDITEPTRPEASTNYYYSYVYATFAKDTDIKYIKFVIDATSWDGVFPGIYNLRYNIFRLSDNIDDGNTQTLITRDDVMADSYTYTVSATAPTGFVEGNPARVELVEIDQWRVSEDWGYYWHLDSVPNNSGVCNVKGYALFDASEYIDNFVFKIHTDDASGNKRIINTVKIYGSVDKNNWVEIDYNLTEPTRPTASTNYYYSYAYAAFAKDTNIRYIKFEINSNSWDGVFPGIYSFSYNNVKVVEENDTESEPEIIITKDEEMPDSYTYTVATTDSNGVVKANPDSVEFSDLSQWFIGDDWGKYWHLDSKPNENGMCDVKGYAIFDSESVIDNFAFKVHHDNSDSTKRIEDTVTLYASTDKEKWIKINYNITEPEKTGKTNNWYYSYVYASFKENADIRYIKFEIDSNSWDGIFPGIYNFRYNCSVFTTDKNVDVYSGKLEFEESKMSSKTPYVWEKYTSDDWGHGPFWRVWNKDSSAQLSATFGEAVFDAQVIIDNFRFKVYTDTADRLSSALGVYVSSDGKTWIKVSYKVSELTKLSENGASKWGYVSVALKDTAKIRYVKVKLSSNNSSWRGIYPGIYHFEYNPRNISQAQKYAYLNYPAEAEAFAEEGYYWFYASDVSTAKGKASYAVRNQGDEKGMSYSKGYLVFESYNPITDYRFMTIDTSDLGVNARNITIYASSDNKNWDELVYYTENKGLNDWNTPRYQIAMYGTLDKEKNYRFIKIKMPYENKSWHGVFPSVVSFEYNTGVSSAELKASYAYNLAASKGESLTEGWTRTGNKATFGDKTYYSYWFGSKNDYNKSGEVIFTDPKGGKITDFNITVGEILNCNDYDGSGQQEGPLNGRILFYASSDGENWKKVDYSRKENQTYNLNNVVYPIYDCYGSFDETDQITYIKLVFKGNEYSVCKWYKIASLFRVQFNSTSALSGDEIFLDESKEDINKIYGFVDDKTKYSYTVTPLEANAHAESDSEWYYFTGDVNGTAVYAVKEKKLASDGMTFTKGSLEYSSFNHFTAFSLGVVDISPKADTVKTLTVYASEDGKNWVKVPYKVEYVGNFWNSAERYEYNIYGTLGKNSKYHYIRVITDYANKSWKGIFPGILDFSYNTDGSAASLKKNYDITLFGNQGEAVATNGGELKSLLSVKYDDEYTYPNYYFGKNKDNATYEGYITYSDLSGGYILDYNINLSLRDHGCSWATGTISKTPAGLLNGRIKILVSANGQDWFNADYTAKLLREETLGDNKNIILNNYNCFGSFKESDKVKFIRLVFVNNKESNEKYYPVPAVSRVQMNTTKKFETPTLEKYDYIYYPYDAVSGVYDDVSKWSFYNSEYHDDGVWRVYGETDKNGFSNTKGYVIFKNNDVYTGFYLRVFDIERNANHVQQIKILASSDGKNWDNINYVLCEPTKVMAHYNEWGNFWQFGMRGVLDTNKKYTQIRVEMPENNRTWYGIAPAIYDLRYTSTRKPSEKTTYDFTYTGESEQLKAEATNGGEWKISDITEIDGVKYGGYWFGRTEEYNAYEGVVTYTPETGEAITDYNITLGIMRNCGYMYPGESRTLGPLNGYIKLEASKDGKNWFNISYSDDHVKQYVSGGVKYDIYDCYGSFERSDGVKQIRLVWMTNKQVFNMYYNTPNVFRVQMNAPRIPESIYPYDTDEAREEEITVDLSTAVIDSSNITNSDGVLTLTDPSAEGWFIVKGNKISWFIARITKKASTKVTAYRADSVSGEWTQLDLKSFSYYLYMKEKLAIDDRFDYLKIVITPSGTDKTFALNELILHNEKVINFLPEPFGEKEGSILLIDPMDSYDIATDVFEMETKTVTYGIYHKKATIMKRMYADGDAEILYTIPNNAQRLYIREWRRIDNSIDTYALTVLVSKDGKTWQELYVEDMEVNEEIHSDTNDMLVSYQSLDLEKGIKYIKLQAPWLDNSTDGYGIDEVRILYSATATDAQVEGTNTFLVIVLCIASSLVLAGLVIFIIVAKKKQILFFKAKAK